MIFKVPKVITLYALAVALFFVNSVVYLAAQNPPGAYNSPAQGGTSGLPTGLTFASPTLTVSSAGSGNGQLALSGNTSGAATFTAPAVAGTATNPVTMSNIIQGPNGVVGTPTYGFTAFPNTGMFTNGAGTLLFAATGSQILAASSGSFAIATPASSTTFTTGAYLTTANCAVNSASPAACAAAATGSFVVPTTTTTYTVNTTRVTATSRIFLFPHTDTRDLPGAPTCVVPAITAEPVVSAIVAATSFTMALASTTGQTCWDYLVMN